MLHVGRLTLLIKVSPTKNVFRTKHSSFLAAASVTKEKRSVTLSPGLHLPRFTLEQYKSAYCDVITNTGKPLCHNGKQHKGIRYNDIQHNDLQSNDIQRNIENAALSISTFNITNTGIMPNVTMLSLYSEN